MIKLKPEISKNVNKIVPLDKLYSSFLANNNDINGEVLNNVHPIPMGNVLNTTCCKNIPILVPKIIEKKKFTFSLLFNLFVKSFILNLVNIIRKRIDPNSLISVECKGLI